MDPALEPLPDADDRYGAHKEIHSVSMLSKLRSLALEYRWMLAGIIALAIALALVITLLTPPQYTATARIEINPLTESVTQVEGALPTTPLDNREFYQTQYNLLDSQSQAARVARSLNLLSDEEFLVQHGLEELDGDVSIRLRRVAHVLLDGIEITPIRGSALVDISYTGPDPRRSSRIANEWVDQFVSGGLARRSSSSTEASEYLQEQLADLRQKLEDSERALVAYVRRTEIVNLDPGTDEKGRTSVNRSLTTTQLAALNEELAQATAARISAESALAGGTNLDQLNSSALSAMRERRSQLSAEYARLLEQFEPAYPPARGLESQIDELDRSIASEEARLRGATADRGQQARIAERRLSERVDQLKGEFISEQGQNIQYNILQREVDTNRQLYDALLQRFKEIGIVGVGENNVFVIDEAEIPMRPSAPSLPQNLFLGLLFGLLAGTAAVFARESLNQSISSADDVRKYLNVPFLGGIPHVGDQATLQSIDSRSSDLGEAYATVRANLSFTTTQGFPKALLVTSAQPDEGKTTTSLALAINLAKGGKSVIIVDGDLRNPSIHRELNIDHDHGLSNFLSGSEALEKLIRPTSFDGLSVMTAGPIPPSATELLTQERLVQMMETLLRGYDHVIIDAPPVLALSDSPLLARQVGHVLFAVQSERVDRREVARAVEQIARTGARVHGVALTKITSERGSYGYGYGYGYDYGKKSTA